MTNKKTNFDHGASDLLKLGETALSALVGGLRDLHERKEDVGNVVARKLDLVTREEFDAAMAMIKKARNVQDDLDKRLKALEKESKTPPKRKSRIKKSVS